MGVEAQRVGAASPVVKVAAKVEEEEAERAKAAAVAVVAWAAMEAVVA